MALKNKKYFLGIYTLISLPYYDEDLSSILDAQGLIITPIFNSDAKKPQRRIMSLFLGLEHGA
jgi:hypothetical protein